jgi:hypothetical protein
VHDVKGNIQKNNGLMKCRRGNTKYLQPGTNRIGHRGDRQDVQTNSVRHTIKQSANYRVSTKGISVFFAVYNLHIIAINYGG